MSKKYNVNYFIKKFKAIPASKWCTGDFENMANTKKCALGHCGQTIDKYPPKEALELTQLFNKYKRPKTRILKALETIKKVQNG